jgi:hypothetical protein
VGIGEGIGVRFRFEPSRPGAVLRAGLVARARLTAAFRGFRSLAGGDFLRAVGLFEVDRRRDFGFADRCATLFLSRFKPASLFSHGARSVGFTDQAK